MVRNNQKTIRCSVPTIRKTANRALEFLGKKEYQLSILLVSNDEIQELNKQYFKKNRPTDVIAFPMQSGEFSNINPDLLGDVVISVERAFEQSQELGHPFEKELDILIVHGILHLLGFEDDTKGKKDVMMKKTDEILATFD
jgi:probable rRNA maturation factor